jgi:hypothetical protein
MWIPCLTVGLAMVVSIGVGTLAAADTIKVRTDCTGESVCFTSLDGALEELHVPTGGRSLPGPRTRRSCAAAATRTSRASSTCSGLTPC